MDGRLRWAQVGWDGGRRREWMERGGRAKGERVEGGGTEGERAEGEGTEGERMDGEGSEAKREWRERGRREREWMGGRPAPGPASSRTETHGRKGEPDRNTDRLSSQT